MAEMDRQSEQLKCVKKNVENSNTLGSEPCNGTAAPSVPRCSTPEESSVMVTNVLNLEKLDTDLYRCYITVSWHSLSS